MVGERREREREREREKGGERENVLGVSLVKVTILLIIDYGKGRQTYYVHVCKPTSSAALKRGLGIFMMVKMKRSVANQIIFGVAYYLTKPAHSKTCTVVV